MTADFWAWVVVLLVGATIGALVFVIKGDSDSFSDLVFVGVYTGAIIFSLANLLFELFSSPNDILFISGVVTTVCAAAFSVGETLCALIGCADKELKKRALFHWLVIVLPSAVLLGASAFM